MPTGATAPPSRGLASVLAGVRRPRPASQLGPLPQADRRERLKDAAGGAGETGPRARFGSRRDVEARLIGLPPDRAPEWWAPCWDRGVEGDLPADVLFDVLTGYRPDVRVLHGVSVPGTETRIDHVLVGGGGVVVAGTEHYDGRVRSDGVHLRVRGRDVSTVVDVALWRAEAIRGALERSGLRGVPVHGVLHWEHVETLGDRAICLRGVPLLSAGATLGMAATGDRVSPLMVERVTAALAASALH